MLTNLIYASRTAQNLNAEDLNSIVVSSRRNNAVHELTGALCYANGTFLQYFEGERLAVNSLYQHVLKDKRHNKVILVSLNEIAFRQFPTWTMGFFSHEHEIGQLFLRHTRQAEFDPFAMTASGVNEFFDEVVKYVSTTE